MVDYERPKAGFSEIHAACMLCDMGPCWQLGKRDVLRNIFRDSLLSLLCGKGIKKFCIAHVCAHDLCLWRR